MTVNLGCLVRFSFTQLVFLLVSGPGGPNNQNWGQNMGGGPPRGPNMGMPGGPNNQGGFNPQPFGGRMQGPGPRGWGRGGPRFRGRGPKSSKG